MLKNNDHHYGPRASMMAVKWQKSCVYARYKDTEAAAEAAATAEKVKNNRTTGIKFPSNFVSRKTIPNENNNKEQNKINKTMLLFY